MLLDTCALLWLSQGGGRLTRRAIEVIEFSPELYISAISGFEIGIKHQKGKLILPLSVNEWFEIIVEHHDLSILLIISDLGEDGAESESLRSPRRGGSRTARDG